MKNLELLDLLNTPTPLNFFNTSSLVQTATDIFYINDEFIKKFAITNGKTETIPHKISSPILQIDYLPIEAKLCVTSPFTITIIDPYHPQPPAILDFPNEITSVAWNPTLDTLAITSATGSVETLQINTETGDIYVQGATSLDAPIPDTVYVGWGSKDTQFRGSERKQAPKTAEIRPLSYVKPEISWRGNGEMFVINYWIDSRRKFIVFDANCGPLWRLEASYDGLEAPIAWRPTGNMIACVDQANAVVIFEKNGQKRFDFDLGMRKAVKRMKWSPCSRVLALEAENSVVLACSSNYKWYKKQELRFSDSNRLVGFDWMESNDSSLILQVVTESNVVKYVFNTVYHCEGDNVCVIDGNCVKLTRFGDAIIPPVLFAKEIALPIEETVNFIAMDEERVVIVDSGNILMVYNLNLEEIERFNLWEVTTNNRLESTLEVPLLCHHFLLDANLIHFTLNTDTFTFDTKTLQLIPRKEEPSFFKTTTIALKHTPSGNSVALLPNGHLFYNTTKIQDGVTSILLHDAKYLLYTTKTNRLYCSRLTNIENTSPISRTIEQGAILVCGVKNTPGIVLQMPRGNLETISSRLISIDILDQLLNEQQWRKACIFIRIEKLNANLLFDLNPNRFLAEIADFITSIPTGNELNAICLEFEAGNVLESMYGGCLERQAFAGDKIEAIFGAILTFFDSCADYSAYISTIVVICYNFYELKRALVYLQGLYRRGPHFHGKIADCIAVLKSYGCDEERLFTDSLLLYDLEFAEYVAHRGHLDPRLYEPEFGRFRALSEDRRRFEINIVAKKPQIAVKYLIRCADATETEIGEFLRSHKVGRDAYESIALDSRFFSLISGVFGRELCLKGAYGQAGGVFKRGGLLKEALDAWLRVGAEKWREIVTLCDDLGLEEIEKVRILERMAMEMVEKGGGGVKDAAILLEEYCRNYEMAVKVLVENCCFREAVHLAKTHQKNDLESLIIPACQQHFAYLIEKFAELKSTILGYKTRLIHIRHQKSVRFSQPNYDDDVIDGPNGDVFSDAGSVVSRFSQRSRASSTASSRFRRKEARKKQDLREGGVFEDIALMRALHGLIAEVYGKRAEVIDVISVLVEESSVRLSEIRRLYDLYVGIDREIKRSTGTIWPGHFYASWEGLDRAQMADLENFVQLDVEYRTPPCRETCNIRRETQSVISALLYYFIINNTFIL